MKSGHFRKESIFIMKKTFALVTAILVICSLLVSGCGRETAKNLQTELPSKTESGEEEENASNAKSTDIEKKNDSKQKDSDTETESSEEDKPNSNNQNKETESQNDRNTRNQGTVIPGKAAEGNPTVTPASSGALHVEGTALTDENGNAVQLKGISTHGLAWFPDYVNKDCFRELRDNWNVNVIRLAMYTSEYGGYCSGGDKNGLKDLVKNGVSYATELGMYVIIDWHILSDGNPNTYKEEAKSFFAEMAELYSDHNNVLYEICNEPNGGTGWSEIKSYAEEIIPVIRSYDDDGIIIVGTPNWSQYVDQAAADPITGYENIMYTLHFYAATHTDSLRNTMTAAINAGLPIFVTEYGICDASGNGAIDENQANQWVSVMNQYGVSYVAWNLSNKSETSAILNSNTTKTSGFSENDLSASGKWLYQMLTGKTELPTPGGQETPPSDPVKNDPAGDGGQSPAPSVSLGSGEITFTAELKNSWESDGKSFYQYELTLQNTTGNDCTSWAIDVAFNETVTLSDGWNGDYTVSGSTLHITSKDYNGTISAGGSAGNIGFIVCGSNRLSIVP